jgi:hypothetical protein
MPDFMTRCLIMLSVDTVRKVSLEVRHQQENEEVGPGLMESLRIKMLVQGDTPEVTRSVRVEFSSEADLFFQYVHEIDEEGEAVHPRFHR